MLRLHLLKEVDLDSLGVKKGHRKEILKHQEPLPKPGLDLSMEYDLFLSIMRISKCKKSLIENV